MAALSRNVPFEADGKSYSLRLGMNDMVKLEDATGVSIMELFSRMEKANGLEARTMRTMFHCMLVGDRTEEESGAIMDEVGIATSLELIVKAVHAAFPEAQPGNGKRPKR